MIPRPHLALGALLGTALFLSMGIVLAQGGILNLGKPTDATSWNPHFPLSGFHRVSLNLRAHSRPEFLVISQSSYGEVDVEERWAIVKALDQFGGLYGTHPVERPSFNIKLGGREYPEHTASTIDWTGAVYRSPYISFVHKDLQRYDPTIENFTPYQKLSRTENRLYRRYAEVKGPSGQGTDNLPLIAVGNYLQTISQNLLDADFRAPPGPQNQLGDNLSFDDIQAALISEKDPPQTQLVEHTNAEANILSALICHADGGRPTRVCGQKVIKQILKFVR